MTNEGCYSCRLNAADGVALPIRERIFDDGNWRVVHAISSSLPGWLCVVSRRHITTLSELSAAEAEALGPLLKRLSDALERVTGALKCYVMFFAEAPGFDHLHIHVAPRLPDCPEDRLGPKLISYLGEPEERWLSAQQMDEVAIRVRKALSEMAPVPINERSAAEERVDNPRRA